MPAPTPLEPDTLALLTAMQRAGVRSWSELGVEGSRHRMRTTARPPGPAMSFVEDRTLAGPHGALAVRLYRPTEEADLPVLVYFHGGGMVVGDLDAFDAVARRLAAASGAAVLSVDYRLAPEHPYPVANDEAYAALAWIYKEAGPLGFDPARIGVAGDSAGGSLAAAVALQARDESGPAVAVQLLMYPGLERYNPDRASMIAFAGGPMLTAADVAWFKQLYLGPDPSTDTPYGVPLLATDLTSLPPAIIVTAGVDPLRDSGEAYGHRLLDAGVRVALLRYPGVCHGFMAAAGAVALGRAAFADAGALLRTWLARPA